MAQQINLCLPILRKQKESFTAPKLAQALLILLVGGGALAAAWVASLHTANTTLQNRLTAQEKELRDMQHALDQVKAGTGPVQAGLLQELAQRKTHLQERQKVVVALKQGLSTPGHGHAARLQLVARTIPASVWMTHLKADTQMLQVDGYTLEPAALNTWVSKLASSDLLDGQTLNTIKVESVSPSAEKSTGQAGAPKPVASGAVAAVGSSTPTWSFSLLNRLAPPVGGKP